MYNRFIFVYPFFLFLLYVAIFVTITTKSVLEETRSLYFENEVLIHDSVASFDRNLLTTGVDFNFGEDTLALCNVIKN